MAIRKYRTYERVFIPRSLKRNNLQFDYLEVPSAEIYLSYLDDNTFLTCEIRGENVLYLRTTIICGVAHEEELNVSDDDFENLEAQARWESPETKSVLFIPWNKNEELELHLFDGSIDGECQVRVKFKSKRSAKDFKPPEWIGREVTGQEEYSDLSIAKNGYPK